jgi:hypothetical protein
MQGSGAKICGPRSNHLNSNQINDVGYFLAGGYCNLQVLKIKVCDQLIVWQATKPEKPRSLRFQLLTLNPLSFLCARHVSVPVFKSQMLKWQKNKYWTTSPNMTSLFLLLHPWLHKSPKGSLHQILPSCSSCLVNGFVRKGSGSHVQYRVM